MSLTVSDPIPLRSGTRDHLRVVTGASEGRVSLLLRVGKQPCVTVTVDLDTSAARALRAALPKPPAK